VFRDDTFPARALRVLARNLFRRVAPLASAQAVLENDGTDGMKSAIQALNS